MRKLILSFLFSIIPAFALAEINPSEMTFEEFDQTQESGWRALAEDGKHSEAAKLIDRYINENSEAPQKSDVLHFHAGQMYAFANEYGMAVKRLNNSFKTVYPEIYDPYGKQWNSYVHATISFLKNDIVALRKYRNEVANGPDGIMKKSNGRVIDRLILNIGKSYSEAYSESPIKPNKIMEATLT